MNRLSSIIDQIIASPEGGTLHLHGHPLPSGGFMVGGAGTALVFRSPDEIDRELLNRFLASGQSPHVGWWTDAATGKVWVDWSSHFDQSWFADGIARDRGEIAFWDIANAREVRTSRG